MLNATGGAGGVLRLCGVVGAGYDSQWDSVRLNEGVHAVRVSSGGPNGYAVVATRCSLVVADAVF